MSEKLLIEMTPFETRLALFEAGQLEAIHFLKTGTALLPGTPLVGRVRTVVPQLEAAFVDIGVGDDAFLPLPKKALASTREGDLVMAGLAHLGTGDAGQAGEPGNKGAKGPRLSREISLPGRGLVLVIGGNGVHWSRRLDGAARASLEAMITSLGLDTARFGLIVRTQAGRLDVAVLRQEFEALMGEGEAVLAAGKALDRPGPLMDGAAALALFGRRLVGDGGIIICDNGMMAGDLKLAFVDVRPDLASAVTVTGSRALMEDAGVDEALEQLLSGRMGLASGGQIVVEPTESLTAIDVNSGATPSHKGATGHKGSRALATNLEAADEIARVLRVGNIGGLVVIDFLNMSHKAEMAKVLERLRGAVLSDEAAVRVGGFSKLGLCDLSRPRRGPSVFDQLGKKAFAGALNLEALAARAVRLALKASEGEAGGVIECLVAPEVLALIEKRREALRAGGKGDMMAALEARVRFCARADFESARIETRVLD